MFLCLEFIDRINLLCARTIVCLGCEEQYRQRLIQTLKQFGDYQENEETKDIALSEDSYVDPKLIIYGGLMGQSR